MMKPMSCTETLHPSLACALWRSPGAFKMSTCPRSTQAHEVVLPQPHVLPISLGAYLCYHPHGLPPTSRLFTPTLKEQHMSLASLVPMCHSASPTLDTVRSKASNRFFCSSREPHGYQMTPPHFLVPLYAPPPGIIPFSL